MLDGTYMKQPRALGRAELSSKLYQGRSVLGGLHQAGCMRLLFPRARANLNAVLINTAGGVTGGDRLSLSARVGQGSTMSITTQAAERAYRAQPHEVGRVEAEITVEAGAELHWLPQELILFEGSRLRRRLAVTLEKTAKALLVEPLVFGRTAMGETLHDIEFRDRISVYRDGKPIYLDGVRLHGNAAQHLARLATGQGANVMASLVYIAPDAPRHLEAVRAHLTTLGGASLLADDVLSIRLVAQDSFVLRQHLIPLIERLSNDALPACWRL